MATISVGQSPRAVPRAANALGIHPLARIAVFRALQLGDMLCAVPALRALRHAMPYAHITLIGLPWAASFARRFAHYIDDFVAFPGAPGLRERCATAEETTAFFTHARAATFDCALQLHGSGDQSNQVVFALGARVCAGFRPPGQNAAANHAHFLAYPEHESEVRRLLRLLEFLGIASRGESLEFPITGDEWRAAVRLRSMNKLETGEYVCIHAGARAATRRWSPERFARVADALSKRGLRVVLTGSAEEAAIADKVICAMVARPINLVGATSLGELAAVVSGARAVVSNDTGISHLAAALRVPSVVIYTASSPERWAPADQARHRRVMHHVDCRPCEHETCPVGHICVEGVTPEQVIKQAMELLET